MHRRTTGERCLNASSWCGRTYPECIVKFPALSPSAPFAQIGQLLALSPLNRVYTTVLLQLVVTRHKSFLWFKSYTSPSRHLQPDIRQKLRKNQEKSSISLTLWAAPFWINPRVPYTVVKVIPSSLIIHRPWMWMVKQYTGLLWIRFVVFALKCMTVRARMQNSWVGQSDRATSVDTHPPANHNVTFLTSINYLFGLKN